MSSTLKKDADMHQAVKRGSIAIQASLAGEKLLQRKSISELMGGPDTNKAPEKDPMEEMAEH